MKKRLFLAIPLSDSLLEKLAGMGGLHAHERGIRWTTRQNLHITVYFFGDVEESDIPGMSGKIKEVVEATPRFNLEFEKIMYAPPNRPPRMIWADFAGCHPYTKLVRAVYDNTKNFLNPASAQETGRAPHPHITLARLNNPDAARFLKLEPIAPEKMTAEKCILFSSELTPKGPVYTAEESYAFQMKEIFDSIKKS
jgi:2'-5' RNA ligase